MNKKQQLNRRDFLRLSIYALGSTSITHFVAPSALSAQLGLPSITESSKQHVYLSTLGQFGHGKTTLTAAITKVLSLKGWAEFQSYDQINLSPEENARGITITIARVEYETEIRQYTQVDCPRHRDYVRNIITGAASMDGAILVVAAPDGPMLETREHILLAHQIGVPAMVVFLNKIDLVNDKELLELVELEVSELLWSYGFSSDTPIVHGSALNALQSASNDPEAPEYACIWELMNKVDSYVPTPESDAAHPFLMAIEDVFSIKGRGTVVTGRVTRGTVKKGDEIEIVGLRDEIIRTVVDGVEMFLRELPLAKAGDNAGILLRGIDRDEVERGMVLATPGSLSPHKSFMSEVYVLREDEGGQGKAFFNGYRPQFYIRTVDLIGTITLPDNMEMVMPGDTALLQVKLSLPVALELGTKFAIREGGLTIGAGIVIELLD